MAPPVNDNWADATTLTGSSGSLTGQSNVDATVEVGEPAAFSGSGGNQRTIWYKITPTENDLTLTVSTEGTVGMDTVLDVFTGSAVNALTRIAGDDDSGTGTLSVVSWTATAGTTYYVRVAAYGSSETSSTIQVNWSQAGCLGQWEMWATLSTASGAEHTDHDTSDGAQSFALTEDGTKGLVMYQSRFGGFDPHVVVYEWPAFNAVSPVLTEIGDVDLSGSAIPGHSFANICGGPGDTFFVLWHNSDTHNDMFIDQYHVNGTYLGRIATFNETESEPSTTWGWNHGGMQWDPVANVGYVLLRDNSASGAQYVSLWQVTAAGAKTRLGIWSGTTEAFGYWLHAGTNFETLHFQLYTNDLAGMVVVTYDVASGTFTVGSTTSANWRRRILNSLYWIGGEPYGDGIIYYTDATNAFDLGSVNSPGTGTQRTTGGASISNANHSTAATYHHSMVGTVRYNSGLERMEFYRMVACPPPEGIPCWQYVPSIAVNGRGVWVSPC